MVFSIKTKVLNQVTQDSISHYPREICGLFVCTNKSQIIDQFISIKNISKMENQFTFDPEDFVKAIYKVENDNARIIGVVHSHPNTDAYPSVNDITNWHYSEWSYWIYSNKTNKLMAYTIKNKQMQEISYHVID